MFLPPQTLKPGWAACIGFVISWSQTVGFTIFLFHHPGADDQQEGTGKVKRNLGTSKLFFIPKMETGESSTQLTSIADISSWSE